MCNVRAEERKTPKRGVSLYVNDQLEIPIAVWNNIAPHHCYVMRGASIASTWCVLAYPLVGLA